MEAWNHANRDNLACSRFTKKMGGGAEMNGRDVAYQEIKLPSPKYKRAHLLSSVQYDAKLDLKYSIFCCHEMGSTSRN